MVQVGQDQDYRLKMRYSADQETRLHVFVNRVLIKGLAANANEVRCAATGEKFSDYDFGIVKLKAGDNYIRVYTRDNSDLRVDAFELTPQYSR